MKWFKVLTVWIGLVAASPSGASTILVYGDSLSAAYGIDLEQGWVSLVSQALGPKYTLVNASISGETSSGGLNRLPHTLDEMQPDLVLLELGANDGLRGGSIPNLQRNLQAMIELLQARNIQTVLIGIGVPPSYGPRYVDEFRAVFPALADDYGLPLLDFYREEFFLKPNFIQADGLHPTATAQPVIADLVLDFLRSESLISP